METKKSKAGHNLRLLQVTVESASQPIARDATLRLRTQSAPASSHYMEIHIDGQIMVGGISPTPNIAFSFLG